MSWTSWIATFGALSWLPHIISWVNKALTKPKLQFVSQDIAEVGYTGFGPIFNQEFAISASKKDALIEKIEVTIVHESGEKHNFLWKFLDERGPEITSIPGGTAEFRKHQPAIALRVSVVGLIEKKIGFNDIDYQMKLISLNELSNEQMVYLEKSEGEQYKEKAIKTKEFMDLLKFIEKGFYWKEGKYDVYLNVYETSLKNPHVEYYQFELTKRHVELLEKNIKATQEWITDLIRYRGIELKEIPKYTWNWAYPSVRRTRKD